MKKTITFFSVLLFAIMSLNLMATSDVYYSDGAWHAYTDENPVYSGARMFDAINAACSHEGSGTINITGSGTSGPGTSSIYAISPRSNQTLDFHGGTIDCNGNELVVAIRADRKDNITIKNVKVVGHPRYGFWFTGCNNVTFTNITMDISTGLGIRYSGRDNYSSNLKINGDINIKSSGHSIETYSVEGVDIETVTVESKNGCGVLFNDSRNCYIDAIYAYNCNTGGSYAAFRQANNNGSTHCGFLYARNCGRGLYTLTNSHDVTVNEVDIADCTTSGISPAGTAYNVRVNKGTVSNTPKAVDIWNGASNICIRVNGSNYGDACNSFAGEYRLKNRSTGLFLDGMGRTAFGSTIGQYADTYHPNAFWVFEQKGNYYKLRNRGTGLYLDGMGRTDNGDDCGQYFSSGSNNQLWERVSTDNGYYRFINVGTGMVLDGMGRTNDGDNVGQWNDSYHNNAQWSLESILKSTESEISVNHKHSEVNIYPNPTNSGNFSIDLSNIEVKDVVNVEIFTCDGRKICSRQYSGNATINMDIAMKEGMYYVKISNAGQVVTKKIIVL